MIDKVLTEKNFTLSRRTFIELLQKNYPDFERYIGIIKEDIGKMKEK